MAKITASDVKALRKQTGAGMMDCKKALVEASGDHEKAIEILRKKGQKVAANRAERESTEGLVLLKINEEKSEGVIISLNCETDFVAKNKDFLKFATEILSFLDNLQRALNSIDIEKSKEKDESISHFIEGIELTEKQVIEIFKKFNIEKINSLNEVFDPNLHQAMFEVEKEDMEPGYVAEVVQEGYMIGERLLRPAMVGVSKKKK